MKTFLLIVGLFPISLFSQTFAELDTTNTIIKEYGWTTKAESEHIIKFFSCMKKNYKYNYKDDAFFNKKKDINLYNRVYLGEYQLRIELQKVYKKCVKKEDIDY